MLHFVVGVLVLLLAIFVWRSKQYRSSNLIGGLQSKAVFITGCDSGFGRGLAKHLDSMGVRVFAGCLSVELAKSLKEETSDFLTTIPLDVTSSDSIIQAYATVKHHLSKSTNNTELWAIVNNAGILGPFGTTEMMSRQDYRHVMEVNFFGQVDVISTFLPLLKRSKGRIVNMASVSGLNPHATLGFMAPYTPSKFAVVGYTEALRRDMRQWDIGVSLIIPGGHRTDLVSVRGQNARFKQMWDKLPPSVQAEYGPEWLGTVCENYSQLSPFIEGMPDIKPVVQAYTQAIFSTSPKFRYLVGVDAHLFKNLANFPYLLMDWLLDGPLKAMVIPKASSLCSGVYSRTTQIKVNGVTRKSSVGQM